ncbi:hypothetical protein [Chryseobacterium oryctis]|uniref:Uncharacterized protein n=1 Tax=Chryseobacterium oryctis TaxID=2952618 RepID=A0ABT3HMD3_9FLAO|nr:hypothetical protein [Chryseobacterium oryctis]MCW3160944.1 hypothetical protein [Chryseobacterium oryctis]
MKTEVKAFKITSLKGNNYLVEVVNDGNTLPQVKVFKQVENAFEVAKNEFDISPTIEGRKSELNTREMWNKILKIIPIVLMLCVFINSCQKHASSEPLDIDPLRSVYFYDNYGVGYNMRDAKNIKDAEDRADIYLNRLDKYFEFLASKPVNGVNENRKFEAMGYLDKYSNNEVFKIENLSREDQLQVQQYIYSKRKMLDKWFKR